MLDTAVNKKKFIRKFSYEVKIVKESYLNSLEWNQIDNNKNLR